MFTADLSFVTEKHQLIPATQYGGCPGRSTTDAVHSIIGKIKDTWSTKKSAAILFMDVQGAFPNTVKEVLLHNMRARHVPTNYVCFVENKLTNCFTCLHFNDYTSDLIPTTNGTTQGCPGAMEEYKF